MIIGVDIGISLAKAVSIENGRVVKKIKTRAGDAVTSGAGALGKLMLENGIGMGEIERIVITGVGASKISGDFFGIPTEKIDEISATGAGGMFLAGRDDVIITNIGTGTSIIRAARDKITHIGGTGVGGGTILGLSKQLLRTTTFADIMTMAEHGDLSQTDILLKDISDDTIGFLGPEATAANFGKMLDSARSEDIALAVLNMVYQVIGLLSVFAARSAGAERVLVTGRGSDNAIGKKIFASISRLYGVGFDFPVDAEYTTAIGAGLARSGSPPAIAES